MMYNDIVISIDRTIRIDVIYIDGNIFDRRIYVYISKHCHWDCYCYYYYRTMDDDDMWSNNDSMGLGKDPNLLQLMDGMMDDSSVDWMDIGWVYHLGSSTGEMTNSVSLLVVDYTLVRY
jgi:hypothetical protein